MEITMPTLEQIPLCKINSEDTTFLITFLPDLEPLKVSLQLVGLLEPLILREKTDKTYQIVCGFKRAEVLRLLAIGEAAAFVYLPGELNDLQALLLTIGHNMTRSLNLAEKAQTLKKLLGFGVVEREVIDRFLPLFALQPNVRILRQTTALLSLEREILEYLVEEALSASTAVCLLDLDEDDQKAILPLLRAFRPGENRIKEIIAFLREISLRDGVPIESLLTGKDIGELLTAVQTPRPQRLEQLRRIIKQMRFPLLTAMEQRFAAYRQSLALPPQISFHPPPFFEGEEFKMELKFKDLRSFRELIASLRRIADKAVGDTDPLSDLSRNR
jgi:ParB family chromosome partitioning protein